MLQKYYQQAYSEYHGNVTEFIGTGEGRELTRLENLRIRTKYPKVVDWYESHDQAGKERIDGYLARKCESDKDNKRTNSSQNR